MGREGRPDVVKPPLGLAWGLLLFICLSTASWTPGFSQCERPDLQEVVAARDTSALRAAAERLAPCPQWQDSVGMLYHLLGVAHYRNGELDAAITFSRKAVAVRERLFAENPFPDLGQTYYNLGAFYRESVANYAARDVLEKSAAVYRQVGDIYGEGNALLALGAVHQYLGDYEKAENTLSYLLTQLPEEEAYMRAEAQLNLSLLRLSQERYAEVVELTTAAAPAFGSYADDPNLPACLHNQVVALRKLDRLAEATRVAEKTLQLYRALGDTYSEASLRNVLGLVQIDQGDYAAARSTLSEALRMAQAAGYADMVAITYDNLGELALAEEQPSRALDAFAASVTATLPQLAEATQLSDALRSDLRQISDKENLFIAIYDYTRAALALPTAEADHDRLIFLARVGDYLLEELRFSHTTEQTKLFWRQKALPFYENMVAACVRVADAREAFFFMEQSKAVLLLDALLESRAQEALPDSLQQQLVSLDAQLQYLRASLPEQTGKEKAATLRKILDKEATQRKTYATVLAEHGQYRNILADRPQTDPQSFREQYLAADTYWVHYFFGQTAVYALVLGPDRLDVQRLGDSKVIGAATSAVLRYFQQADQLAADPGGYLAAATDLYEQIVSPLALPKGSSLWIVPDGPLAYLPFEALPTAAVPSLAEAHYLLETHQLGYAFSAQLFQELSDRSSVSERQELVAFAPFVEAGFADLPRLPFSAQELDYIATHFPLVRLEREAASLEALLSRRETAGVLHFSTHAFASYDDSEQPRVFLADTVVRLRDLYLLKIPAELVVLSACQSNIGQLAQGEGVLGLGRGFCHAGAGSFVAGLWQLNDQYTSRLIDHFYRELAAGQTKVAALRQAKLAFLQDPDIPAFQKSPYYWAGLTYYGDARGLQLASGTMSYAWWLAAGGLIVLLGGGSWYRRRFSKS